MVRICKPVLAVLAGLALVAGGCGSAATASPSNTSPSAGPTASAALATPTPANPDTLFDQSIAEGPDWKTFHLKIELSGTIKGSFLKDTELGKLERIKSDVALDGTVIEGDMDATNLACHLAITVPASPGASAGSTPGDLIIKNSIAYLKPPGGGTKYNESTLRAMADFFGVKAPVPTPGGSSLVGIADAVSTLRQHLEANGATPTLAGIERIGDRDAYRINLALPLDKLNSDIAAAVASKDPALDVNVDSASASLWIYTDNYQLAQVQMAGASSIAGNITFTMTLTSFDQPVTITAPAASDIEPES